MRYFNRLVFLTLTAVLCANSATAQSDAVSRVTILSGYCLPKSQTAEGPVNSDLAKYKSRYRCNSAVLTYFGPQRRHLLIQFAQKQSQLPSVLGYSGYITSEGSMMKIDRIQFIAGSPIPANDGMCIFSQIG